MVSSTVDNVKGFLSGAFVSYDRFRKCHLQAVQRPGDERYDPRRFIHNLPQPSALR